MVGVRVAGSIDADLLKVVLSVGIFGVALSFLRAPEQKDVVRMDDAIEQEYGGENGESCLVSTAGERICYTVCNRWFLLYTLAFTGLALLLSGFR